MTKVKSRKERLITRAAGCLLRNDQAGYRRARRELRDSVSPEKVQSLIEQEKARLRKQEKQLAVTA